MLYNSSWQLIYQYFIKLFEISANTYKSQYQNFPNHILIFDHQNLPRQLYIFYVVARNIDGCLIWWFSVSENFMFQYIIWYCDCIADTLGLTVWHSSVEIRHSPTPTHMHTINHIIVCASAYIELVFIYFAQDKVQEVTLTI